MRPAKNVCFFLEQLLDCNRVSLGEDCESLTEAGTVPAARALAQVEEQVSNSELLDTHESNLVRPTLPYLRFGGRSAPPARVAKSAGAKVHSRPDVGKGQQGRKICYFTF